MKKNLNLSDTEEDYRVNDDYKTLGEDEDVQGELCHNCFNEEPYVKVCRKCKKTGFLKALRY